MGHKRQLTQGWEGEAALTTKPDRDRGSRMSDCAESGHDLEHTRNEPGRRDPDDTCRQASVGDARRRLPQGRNQVS